MVCLRRCLLVCVALWGVAFSSAADAPLELSPLPGPAAARACAPTFATSPDGLVYLGWLEPAGNAAWAFRLAAFDAASRAWSPARTIAVSTALIPNPTDPPQLAAGANGRLAALWCLAPEKKNPSAAHAWFSRSDDGGSTWTLPQPLSRESRTIEFPSLAALPNARFLAAWLDGRGKARGGETQQLYARQLGDAQPDRLIDDVVCDCCSTALLGFPDGTALLAYRNRSAGEIRDIFVARFADGAWTEPHALNDDGWRLDGCPVNGPRLAAVGGHVAAAWFTAADADPRVLVSTSPDAGARFTMPQRIELRRAAGRADLVRLRDGTRVVSWIEAADPVAKRPATLYARRLSPADELGEPIAIAPATDLRTLGYPRLAVVKDYDRTPAEAVIVYGTADGVAAHLLALPPLSALAGRDPCAPCDEAEAAAARGFALRGEIIALTPARHVVLVKHEAIPGVMRAMTMEFTVDEATLGSLAAGNTILGRIERRGRSWWLFAVQVLALP